MNYIKSVEIISPVTPLNSGIKVEFNKPITFIVGDNGVGKSTLLECIRDHFGYKDDTYMRRQNMKSHINIEKSEEPFNFTYIDFHGDDRKFAGSFGNNLSLQIIQARASSGQVSISLLNDALKDLKKVENGVVIFDEPCRGQSIKNQYYVIRLIGGLMIKYNCQLIVTSHSDIILKFFADIAQYYNIVKNENTTYQEYINSQMK
jgi:predicted ATPase